MKTEWTFTLYRWMQNAPDYARLYDGANFVIENIDEFITRNFEPFFTWNEDTAFNRVPALEMSLKAPIERTANAGLKISNATDYGGVAYCRGEYTEVDDDGTSFRFRTYYFFVTNIVSLGANTQRIELHMDTLNSFTPGVDGGISFDEETLVVREHRDRFVPHETTPGTWDGKTFRHIDDSDEGFSTPLFPFERERLDEPEAYLNQKCYLVYRASNELSPDDLENPLNVYLAYENGIPGTPSKAASSTSVTMGGASVTEALTYFFPRWANPSLTKITFTCWNDGSEEQVEVALDPSVYATCDGIAVSAGGYGGGEDNYSIDYVIISSYPISILKTQRQAHILVPESVAHPHAYRFALDNCNYYLGGYSGFVTDQNFPSWLGNKRWPDDYILGNGSGGVLFASIAQVNRYDSRNVKIIALPYSPVKWIDKGGYYDPPSGYNFDAANGLLSPGNLDGPFKREIVSAFHLEEATYSKYPTSPSATLALIPRDDSLESKRFNSSFYSLKFVYDAFSLPLMLERCTFFSGSVPADGAYLPIYYRQSANISSKLAFSLVSEPSDFEGTLATFSSSRLGISYEAPFDWSVSFVCARNNELPIFTSDYLNYIRMGYNYDVKAKDLAWTSGWISTATGIVGSGVKPVAQFATGDPVRGAVSSAQTLMGSIDSVAQTIIGGIERDNALEKTLHTKAMGSVGVSGSDDLDLFEWTTGNKLWVVRSRPSKKTLQYVLDFFHYFGYATNEKKAPKVHTRANFNFLQCEARFKEEQALGTDIARDLRERYARGVTYLWMNSEAWDFEGKYANYEVWALTGIIK